MLHAPFVLPLREQVKLTTLLTQPHRFYHNINHINDCLAELYQWMNADPKGTQISVVNTHFDELLTYIIWYHDAIYNPYAPPSVNEVQSMKLFYSMHKPQKGYFESDVEWIQLVCESIEATARHLFTQAISNDNKGKVMTGMLDIDLAGFGKPWWITAQHSLNIRKEYPNTSDMDFIKGRLKFLTAINQRETLYYNPYFYDLYHTKSKENIAAEIDILEEAVETDHISRYFDPLWAATDEFFS